MLKKDFNHGNGYTVGTPLIVCPVCGKRDNADRNASLVIGQRLITRYQEKPHTLSTMKEDEKSSGSIISQDAESEQSPSCSLTQRHGERRGHGTARSNECEMDISLLSIATQLRLFNE